MFNLRKSWRYGAALATTATLLAGCGGGASDVAGGSSTAAADTTLTLVAYAVPEPGWSKIIPAFAATPEGKGVGVTTSYGASGDQSRAVVDGKPADIVNFSVEPDVTR
jgi:ABC-type sulfate transport system substrate-binding protein